jgi:hypothetical protein
MPGPIAGTEGVKRLGGEAWEAMRTQTIPLGRYGTVEEIGNAAAFLASPLADLRDRNFCIGGGRGQNLFGSAPLARRWGMKAAAVAAARRAARAKGRARSQSVDPSSRWDCLS